MVTKDYARRRGGCLTAWFIFQGIGVLFALIISLRGLSVSPIFILALLVLYAYVHLLRGIWNWKAWAVKSYAWVILLTNGLQVLFGIDPLRNLMSLILQLSLLYIAIMGKWDQFD
jgi:hypothetical protein